MMLPIEQAAKILNQPPGTLRRLCREGMPCTPGRRGRGHPTLVDPAVVRQWIGGSADTRHLLTLADDLPKLLAAAIFESWKQIEGPGKREAAGFFAACWYNATTSLLDHLRELNGDVPDIQNPLPPEIGHLRKIARGA